MRPRRHRWLTRKEAARLFGAAIGDVWDHDHVTWKCREAGTRLRRERWIIRRRYPAARFTCGLTLCAGGRSTTPERSNAAPRALMKDGVQFRFIVGRRGFVPSATSTQGRSAGTPRLRRESGLPRPKSLRTKNIETSKCLKVWSEWQDSNVRSRTRLSRRIMLKDLCFWLRTQTIVLVRFWRRRGYSGVDPPTLS
jgi:hypothetical protein